MYAFFVEGTTPLNIHVCDPVIMGERQRNMTTRQKTSQENTCMHKTASVLQVDLKMCSTRQNTRTSHVSYEYPSSTSTIPGDI